MHIGFLTPEFPHPDATPAAGIGTSVYNLVSQLCKQNVRVSVFVYGQLTNKIIAGESGVRIHFIKAKNYRVGGWWLYRKYLQNYLNKVISREGINLIEAPDWTGITAFMSLDAPLVLRLHGSDAYFCKLEGRKQKWKNRFFEGRAIKGADAFIAPTEFAARMTAEIFNLSGREISVIHNGVDVRKFQNPYPLKVKHGTILYVGTIIRKKGVLELPSILHALHRRNLHVDLYLIGRDSPDSITQSASTWELIKNALPSALKPHVHYFGPKPYSEVIDYIKSAEVCVFPTYAETLGMVTIEAMALNKAVVSSDLPWVAEILVDGVSGLTENPSRHDQFAVKIQQLLTNPALCQSIGSAARKRVEERFDIEKIAILNIELYKTIAK